MAQSQPSDITREKLIDLLNEDLSREYQAIIAYVVYSQVLKGAEYMTIAEELAVHAGEPLLLRDGAILVAAFHPELTDDSRIHERFLELVVAPGTPAPLRAAANASHAVVLSRPDISGYRGSLRPRPARFSPANEPRSPRGDHQ
jgi:hypothetical protein